MTSALLYGLLGALVFYFLFLKDTKWYPSLREQTARFAVSAFKAEWRDMLEKHHSFYRSLPSRSKKIFEARIGQFIVAKTFVPRNLTEITDEMKVFIAASAIQLTFGLPRIYLAHFHYILVYPDEYYSTITRKYHKGEVNPRNRAIVISWKSYMFGYLENEGINLGLHEMAHALHLENRIRNKEYGFLPQNELMVWDRLADEEIEKIKSGKSGFFREYAATDGYEFFAVAVENFFERPTQFQQYHAGLYGAMSNLLNQNPLLLVA